MKSYSLSTLLLSVFVFALTVSHLILMRQLGLARSEVNDVRRKFGYIRVEDRTKTYVAQIAENESPGDAYRLWIPEGSRYLVHLTDASFETTNHPTDPIPTKTVSLNDWQQGADTVLSATIYWEGNAPRFIVHTKTDEIFDYIPADWQGGSGPSEWTWLQQSGQTEYSANAVIPLMLWRHTGTKRGILLWLEPHAIWEARQRHSDTSGPQPADASRSAPSL